METQLVPGGSFMSACRGDEEQQEVGVMGRENQADRMGGAAAPQPEHLPL